MVTAGAFALIARKVGFGAVFHAFARADPAWLAAGYAVAVLSIVVTVWQWHGLSSANGVRSTFRRCLHLELPATSSTLRCPARSEAISFGPTSLAESPEERVPAAASVVLRRLCNFSGMIVLTAVGLIGTISLGYAGRVRPYSLVVLAGGLVLVAGMLSPVMGSIGQWPLLKRGPGVALASCSPPCTSSGGRRRDLVLAMVRGLLFWTVVVASQSLFIRAVGIHVPLLFERAGGRPRRPR